MIRDELHVPDELDELVLAEYPYPIAVNYKRLLDESDREKKTHICIQVFEYGLRAIALGLISQYLIRDTREVSEPRLNDLLLTRLFRATLGTWNEILFKGLQAYEGKRDLFFMPQLYDVYWDTSMSPHKKRKGLRIPFDRLVQIRNDLAHDVSPRDSDGWQVLFEESFGLLRQVLRHFTFLKHYDLVRIRWSEGEEYWYDIYTGLQVVSPGQPLRTEKGLTAGWFYLSKQEKSFLELHPLIVFWEKELAQVERERIKDAAIFDRFQHTSLDYLATVLGERFSLTDRTSIAEFVHTVIYNIEKVKRTRREAEKLSWRLLKEVAAKVSSERTGDVRSKYHREVYLQRAETRQSFEMFLSSNKTCFVLIGKSGVGKSNFFLSIMDEFEDSSKVCTFVYNGARFGVETDVTQVLSQDFELYLKLEGFVEKEGLGDVLFEINRIDGIMHKKVVLLIDALNENPEARELLRKIDALVEVNPYPWLKVVISSRPETWRTIKRGVHLAEHKYYRQEEAGELGIEMQPFSLGEEFQTPGIEVEIKSFGKEELPVVYAKYQEKYGLQTDYETIPMEVRELLRDPLTLWLVAEIHRGQQIPKDIRVRDLYQQYVKILVQTDRLNSEDVRFLDREMMPLMIRDGECANAISGETISVTETKDGKSLFELIHSDEKLSSGQRVNQSYANLVDAEILMELGTWDDYKIVFKYERFYEYFGGKRLYELNKCKIHPVEAYSFLLGQIKNHPFLWGAVRTALLFELEDGRHNLAAQLSQSSEVDIKELMIATLSEFGKENRDQTERILKELLQLGTGLVNSIRSAMSSKYDYPSHIRVAKHIAVEAAYTLEMENILEKAGCDSSRSVRATVVRFGHALWIKNPEKGMQLIRNLGGKVKTKWGIPNTRALETCAIVSLLAFFERGEDTSGHLRKVWRGVIDDILLFTSDRQASRLKLYVIDWIREKLVRFGARSLINLVRYLEREPNFPLNISELEAFFRNTGQTEKNMFRELIPYLDPSYGDLEQESDKLTSLAKTRDTLIGYVLHLILGVHLLKSMKDTLPLLHRVFELSSTMSPPGPMALMTLLAVAGSLWKSDAPDDDLLQTLGHMQAVFYDICRQSLTSSLRSYRRSNVHSYVSLHWRKHGTTQCKLLDDLLIKAREKGDLWAIGTHAKQISLFAIPYWHLPPKAALASLVPIVPIKEVRPDLIEALAHLRSQCPNEVEDFMEEQRFSDLEKRLVRTKDAAKMTDVLNVIVASFFASALWYEPHEMLREQFIWVLEESLASSNLTEWMSLWFKGAVNLIYGDSVFATEQPPLTAPQLNSLALTEILATKQES